MITIREMQIDDLEQVMPIEEANFSIPWTETGFFTFLIRDDALFLVAEEDGEILGYLGILISFDESEITNVCVAEKARRRGIGRALMEDAARELDPTLWMWSVGCRRERCASFIWMCASAIRRRGICMRVLALCRTASGRGTTISRRRTHC